MNKAVFFILSFNSFFVFAAEEPSPTTTKKKFLRKSTEVIPVKLDKSPSPKTSPKSMKKRDSLSRVQVESFGTQAFMEENDFVKQENVTFANLKRSSGDSK